MADGSRPDVPDVPASARTIAIHTRINDTEHQLEVPPNETLAALLRDRLGLTGVKLSCGLQICGACTVLLNGRSVSACTVLAAEADEANVRTVEGLARDGELTPLQRRFIEHGALQCGFCTPGFLMAATELLEHTPDPDEETTRTWLRGNLCRCTGYQAILDAVADASRDVRVESERADER
jgi:carbon-monoxide dehydrogenase small subunit